MSYFSHNDILQFVGGTFEHAIMGSEEMPRVPEAADSVWEKQ